MDEQATDKPMRPREDRLRVMLPARMRSEGGWSDACILNISSRGLLVYSSGKTRPGTFVEIRRGRQLVVARVVWKNNQRIGLSSPDRVHMQDIISDDAGAAAVVAPTAVERRAVPRTDARSRQRGRMLEFSFLVIVTTAIATWSAVFVHSVMQRPLSRVQSTLSR